jgi:hypothetical protein
VATEAKSQMAFDELGLGSLLKRYLLRVPPNQREYAWTEDEVSQLLQDFSHAINQEGQYFLGTVVTITTADGALEVVDGQQRLATTAILLAAIRNYLKTRNEAVLVDAIDHEFLSGIDRAQKSRVPKLKLNVDDNDLFRWIVCPGEGEGQPATTRSSHEKLVAAFHQAERQVRKVVSLHAEKLHSDELERWISFIEHRATVILVRVPTAKDAFRMFETLNDRGLKTSEADLVKNYLFSRAGNRQGEAQSKWSLMRGAIETASDDSGMLVDFLRHSLIVQRGHIREVEIYDAVQDLVKSEQAAISFLSALESLAQIYVAMFNPESERWNSYPDAVRRSFEVFILFKIKPMRPLILAVSARFSENEAAATLRFLVAVGVRLIVASSTRTSSVELPLALTAKSVYEGTIKTSAQVKSALLDMVPADDEFRDRFADLRIRNARLGRYYLRALQLTANNEKDPWFIPTDDKQVINLEHVLPTSPEGNWPEFTQEDVMRYAPRLGNLALLRAVDNSGLRSAPFSEKRAVYEKAPYSLTAQIAEVAVWTTQAIESRQKGLAELAKKTWPI